MIRNYCLLIVKSVCIIAFSAIVGLLLLLAVYSLPVSPIHQHIKESMTIFDSERDYPKLHAWADMWRDNFTDAIMIGNAGYDGGEPLIEKTLSVYRTSAQYQGNILLPAETLIVTYADNLNIDKDEITFARSEYSRYWHGYLVFLKPLFCLFSYGQIRVLNAIVQTVLLLFAVYLMWKRNAKNAIIPFILIWAILIPPDTAALFQYSDIYYLYTLGTIILLKCFDKWNGTNVFRYLFLALGILTSYFDFLTYPLVSLAIPLGAFLFLNDSASIKEDIRFMAEYSILWGMGYLGMWVFKWVFIILFTDSNISGSVSDSILKWTSHVSDLGESISFLSTVKKLFSMLIVNPAFLISIFYILVSVLLSVILKKYNKHHLIVFGILALYPFAWFAVVMSHSYSHYWFTHKELIIFAFSLMLMFSPSLASTRKYKSSGGKRRKRLEK